MVLFLFFSQIAAGTNLVGWQCLRGPVQLHHHYARLFLGTSFFFDQLREIRLLLLCHPEKWVSVSSWILCLIFGCLFFPKAKHLTPSNLAALQACSLEGQRTYPVEVWKLLFQKALTSLDQALELFATTVNPVPQFHKIFASLWEFCVITKMTFSNPRPPTTASQYFHICSRPSERLELPTSARHSCRVLTLSAAGSRQSCVRFWPLHPPTSYSA